MKNAAIVVLEIGQLLLLLPAILIVWAWCWYEGWTPRGRTPR